MTTTERTEAQGDWDLRGPDFETALYGAITEQIIGADEQVRADGWSNGFPNWAIYRVAIAGDTHLARLVQDWCCAFALAAMECGAVQSRTASDELGIAAGRDAYVRLVSGRWLYPSDTVSEDIGIAPLTYRKFRLKVYARLRASLDEYFIRLQIGMRQVVLLERRDYGRAAAPPVYAEGRGFDRDRAIFGDGNLRAFPRGSGC